MDWINFLRALLWVLCGLIVLVMVLLFIPLKFKICYEKSKFKVTVFLLGLKFNMYPLPKRFNSAASTPSLNSTEPPKNISDNIKKFFTNVSSVFSIAKKSFEEIFKKIKTKKIVFISSIGGADAADAALKYGRMCSVVYPVFGVLNKLANPREYVVRLYPEFLSDKIEIDFVWVLIAKPIDLIIAMFRILKFIREMKSKKKIKMEELS